MATDIVAGDVGSADIVMNMIGSMFNDTAQTIFNADYIGFDSRLNASGSPNLKNVKYDVFKSDLMTGGVYDSANDKYLFISVDDECGTGSIAAHWTTTGETGETSTYIFTRSNSVGEVSTLTSDGSTAIDYDNSLDNHVRFQFEAAEPSSPSPGQADKRFGLTDGTNTVIFKTFGNSVTDNSIWDLYIDEAADTIDLYNDGVLDQSGTDISSLTGGNYYFFMDTALGGTVAGSVEARLHYLYSNKVGDVINITSPATSTSSTLTNAIPVMNASSGITINLSADNGSNYESATNTEIHRFTNTGTNLIFRAIDTISSISIPTTLNEITEFAVKYNFY